MRNLALSLVFTCVCTAGFAQSESKPYNAVVAADGNGNYTSVQAAVNAAPADRTEPWLIFVKKGSYEEQVVIPENKPFIHLIGQDKDNTIIHLSLNVGGQPTLKESERGTSYWNCSVHNPSSPVYKYEGTVVMVKGAHFYTENITYQNDWGVISESGPQALAMSSQADCAAFNNCKFRSFQDTWMTAHSVYGRHYVKSCWIEGAVDYFYGGGDVLVENSTFYNVRSGSVIVAPSHDNVKYGYALVNCTVDGNSRAADGKQKLGRPWKNSPRTVYINTSMRIPVAPEGWTNMGTVPGIFAEYNSRDAGGNLIDLSRRKTEYQYKERGTNIEKSGSCRATITAEEAAKYSYENMIMASDGWNPREIMHELDYPADLRLVNGVMTWKPVNGAAGYIVYDGDDVVAFTTNPSYAINKIKVSLKVAAVNKYGSQGRRIVLRWDSRKY